MRPLMILALFAFAAFAQQSHEDPILKAMGDEMVRSRALQLVERPYYIQYQLEDIESFSASATMGALLNSSRNKFRVPLIEVRVGDYNFDNTNHVYSTYYAGARYDPPQWPIDDRSTVLRRYLWLATDRAYKTAIEGFSRKRASLGNTAVAAEQPPDFSRAEPVKILQPTLKLNLDDAAWTKRVIALSAVFRAYPEIIDSWVDLSAGQGTSYFLSSEGSVQRTPDQLCEIRVRASAQTTDGMMLRNALVFPADNVQSLPPEEEMSRAVQQLADELRALAKAPVGEEYSGPVLFEPAAAAQLFAQALGDNIRATRRPVSDPGRAAPYLPSEFESKIGSRVLPDWMDVVDDATQTDWRGHRLLGHYELDMEGVPPKPVAVIEKGVLKSFLLSRQPVKGFAASNGHARLLGNFGVYNATIGNLFIKASQTMPLPDLRKQLIDLCKKRGKPYGILIRKLDYPSSMSIPEFQALATGSMQGGGGSRPLSPPVLAYRVYPDGHEELVRGLRFRGFSSRLLRDITAASDDAYVFNFVNNGLPFALIGAGGYVAPSTIVSPAVLFDEIELERPQEERSKPPVVPSPSID
jgi:TldD protein